MKPTKECFKRQCSGEQTTFFYKNMTGFDLSSSFSRSLQCYLVLRLNPFFPTYSPGTAEFILQANKLFLCHQTGNFRAQFIDPFPSRRFLVVIKTSSEAEMYYCMDSKPLRKGDLNYIRQYHCYFGIQFAKLPVGPRRF